MAMKDNRLPAPRDAQRGVVMVLFAMACIVVLLVIGLAVDLGIAHVTFSRLSKAVDAGALAGARSAATGSKNVKAIVNRVASANFGSGEGGGATATYTVNLTTPSTDTYNVKVTGVTVSPTLFSRLMSRNRVDVKTVAEAVRYPLDLTLVLDLSMSLERAGAFDDMQLAAKNFIDSFDDSIDQVGIVTYSTYAWDLMTIRKNFKAVGKSLIDAQQAIADTNIEEGMRLGKRQLDVAPHRDNAMKVAVLFTDGRPTAFGDAFRLDGPNSDCGAAPDPVAFNSGVKDADKDNLPECWGGVVATYISGSSFRGLFTANSGMKVVGFNKTTPILEENSSSTSSPTPLRLPGGGNVDGDHIRALGVTQSEEWANAVRTAGYTVYTVGLGDPSGAAGDVPDQPFLQRLANEGGIVNGNQPMGEMLFAPSAAELDGTFARLADRILTRLTR